MGTRNKLVTLDDLEGGDDQVVAALQERVLDTTARPPSWAGTRSRTYDKATRVYGGTDVARHPVRAAVAAALAGVSLVDFLVLADSMHAGYRSTPGVNDPVKLLTNRLKAGGFPVTGPWIFPHNGTPTAGANWDSRVTFSGFSRSQGDDVANVSNYVFTSTNGHTVTYTFTETGTVVEFLVFGALNQAFTYAIDGEGPVAANVGSTTAPTKITRSGLSNAVHTLVITKTAGTTLWVGPARCRQTTGLSITNASIYGSHASDWLTTSRAGVFYNPLNFTLAAVPAPKLTIVSLGGNESIHAGAPEYTPAGLKTSLDTLIAHLEGLGSGVVLSTYPTVSDASVAAAHPSNPTWNLWLDSIYDASDSGDVMLVDQQDGQPASATLLAQGITHADGHLLPAGSAMLAERELRALLTA